VTVIDTVPTLLGILPSDVPSLRLILLGGEALPPAIVQKWSRPGRRILNTYGPDRGDRGRDRGRGPARRGRDDRAADRQLHRLYRQ
jgi:hypothetical protein